MQQTFVSCSLITVLSCSRLGSREARKGLCSTQSFGVPGCRGSAVSNMWATLQMVVELSPTSWLKGKEHGVVAHGMVL